MSWTFHDKNPLGLEKPLWKHQDIKNATPCISTVVLVQLGSQRLSNIQRLEQEKARQIRKVSTKKFSTIVVRVQWCIFSKWKLEFNHRLMTFFPHFLFAFQCQSHKFYTDRKLKPEREERSLVSAEATLFIGLLKRMNL